MKARAATTMRNHPERHPFTAVGALRRGYPLGQRLTIRERLALTVTDTGPTHHLTLSGPATKSSVRDLWPTFYRRWNRSRDTRNAPVIYFGCEAQGLGDGGPHLHLLLWEMPWLARVQKHARELGLGAHVERIAADTDDPMVSLGVVRYILGQHESVFGSREHERHQQKRRSGRRWTHPQRRTLEQHHPRLLAALDLAKDRSVSDLEMFQRLPTFTSNRGRLRWLDAV
jgi:hypothetical protein